MTKWLLSLLILLLSGSTIAQSRCDGIVNLGWLQTNAPDRHQRFVNLESFTTNYINGQTQNNARLVNGNGVIIIPVVVHILHYGESEGSGYNLSLSRIQSQIAVLNEDFRRLNADAINTPSAFLPYAADFNIEFRLACIDPEGNSTSGIVRKNTLVNPFSITGKLRSNGSIDDDLVGIKTNANGSAAWPTDRYLNIWVCNVNTAGYATWPADFSTYPQFDGIVIDTESFGRDQGAVAPYHKGRTATHEIGHWLNLYHLWGNPPPGSDNYSCSYDDNVGDTPPQKDFSAWEGCPTYPYLPTRCNTSDPSVMFMNYMDYVTDVCYNMFTIGQKLRARALFASGGARESQLNNWFKVRQLENPINCVGEIYSNPMCLPTTWTVISGPATITPVVGNTHRAVINATGTGTVRVRAESGNYISEDDIQVTNLPPAQPGPITVNLIDLQLGRIEVEVNDVPGVTYNWYRNGTLEPYYHAYWAKVSIPRGVCDLDYGISVEAVNGCGASPLQWELVYVPCEDYFRVSPNPATTTVTITEKNLNSRSNKKITEVRIYDQQGNMRKKVKFGNIKQVTINVNDISSGIYFIEIISGSYKEKKQILINR